MSNIPKTMVMYSCKFCMDYKKCKDIPDGEFLVVKHHQKDPKCFVHEKVAKSADAKLKQYIGSKKRKKRKSKS